MGDNVSIIVTRREIYHDTKYNAEEQEKVEEKVEEKFIPSE